MGDAQLRCPRQGCQALVAIGRPVLDYLVDERGLDADVLRLNRVGADPGPDMLRRPGGIPRGGVAAVFPVLSPDGGIGYAQSRYLVIPAGRAKYDNPAARLGDNPRHGWITPTVDRRPDVVVICEGVPDAYAAASTGLSAVAILGAKNADQTTATTIARSLHGRTPVIAFDGDPAGRAAAEVLRQAFHQIGLAPAMSTMPTGRDVASLRPAERGALGLTSLV